MTSPFKLTVTRKLRPEFKFPAKIFCWLCNTEVEFTGVGTFFSRTDYLPWEFLLIKKLEIEKTKTAFIISVFKVVYWWVLVFSISNFPRKEIESEKKYLLNSGNSA